MLRYRINQQYEAHPDFFDPASSELRNGGQRAITCLLYLSDVPDCSGGATLWYPGHYLYALGATPQVLDRLPSLRR